MISSYASSDLLRISVFTGLLLILLSFSQRFVRRKQSTGTPLLGPPNPSFLFGHLRLLIKAPNGRGEIYEQWAKTYGPAYRVAGPLGSTRVVICDPRALAHYDSKETFAYVQSKFTKVLMANIFGRGLLYAEGESHRRQRKALSPAFSNASLRKLTHVFYDSVYKAKAHWDSTLHATSGDTLIDVSEWMDHIALDSIGKAAFGHDFESLDGKSKTIAKDLHTLGTSSNGVIGQVIFMLSAIFPWLLHLPTKQNLMIKRLRVSMGQIADELLERNRQELDGKFSGLEDKSIMGLLVKAETNGGSLAMSREEILSQMNVFLIAGYATTSGSLTWALIELCRHPEKQQKLREELFQEAGDDPTFDQLSAGFPYLDAVAQEVLRLHPAVMSTTRVAAEDDIIPFGQPIKTASGEQVFSLVVRKGDTITSPIDCVNTSDAFWGPNSKSFEPERWLDPNGLTGAKDLAGYRHILTFSDGPRMCLGRYFALTEFKAVLFVLLLNYSFELRDGPDTKIESLSSFARRPKIAGEKEPRVLMKLKRLD